ncbi:hypothetical protein [Paenibacillus sp. MMO-177]|uniref:hypothetical protein n=1 Tax=Paenibacillus sp. MMO-177 TaxID=3081289 RepID=UPI003018A8BE
MTQPHNHETIQDECEYLGSKAFSIIELVEVAGVSPKNFEIIRKKLLNLGNDIKRLGDKYAPPEKPKYVLMMPLIKKDGE